MDAKHRGIQIMGLLSLIAGSGIAFLQIRGIFGVTRGFGVGGSQAFWMLLLHMLGLALAVYLLGVGWRALSIAKGRPRSTVRFGWGRIIIGSIGLYNTVLDRFDLVPGAGFKYLEPANEGQAHGMQAGVFVFTLGWILLIFSGIWRGFRAHRSSAKG